jgi:transcription termination factor Rho
MERITGLQSNTPTAADQARGILELHRDGYGFVRNLSFQYETSSNDALVPADLIRHFGLREGLLVTGHVKRSGDEPRGPKHKRRRGTPNGRRLSSVTAIENEAPDQYAGRPAFDGLTPIDPREWLRLETTSNRLTTRVMDMFTPIGKGQRGLIVAPPRTGKTILLQHIAEAISTNYPDVTLFLLLIDERPEEVTEMRRTIRGQVFASCNDRDTASHVRLAQLVIERAKRLVELRRDVVVLLDSITRLARAYNKHVGSTGRTMSGGLDIRAMEVPKRLFGSARAAEEGGSLTVMATALIETGSRMDDVIFEEFKGTGNMELKLDRKLADRRIFPAIDLLQSGTRKEERLLPAEDLRRITLLRRGLVQMNHVEAMESLVGQMGKFPSNAAFLEQVGRFLAR